MENKIGITFGGYCPMHQGHLECILRAKKECSEVYVVVCGYDNEPRANELGLSYRERLKLIQDYFKDDEIINVIGVNDTELGIDDESMSMSNWYIWLDDVFSKVSKQSAIYGFMDDENPIYIYVGEPKYYKSLEELKNDYSIEPVLVGVTDDGERINGISATAIRQKPLKYWNKITAPFKPYLTKRILITGTASEGKTTMVKDLARYFQCPYTTEFGRDYMELHDMKDPDLTFQEFFNFLYGQNTYYRDAIKSPGNNGVIISDTDNIVTLMYARAYVDNSEMQINMDEYLTLYNCVKHMQGEIKWDKIFVLPPRNTFVDDGSRYMGQSSMEERQANFDKLMGLLEEFGLMDKVEVLFSDFNGNFNRVKDYINSLYI